MYFVRHVHLYFSSKYNEISLIWYYEASDFKTWKRDRYECKIS